MDSSVCAPPGERYARSDEPLLSGKYDLYERERDRTCADAALGFSRQIRKFDDAPAPDDKAGAAAERSLMKRAQPCRNAPDRAEKCRGHRNLRGDRREPEQPAHPWRRQRGRLTAGNTKQPGRTWRCAGEGMLRMAPRRDWGGADGRRGGMRAMALRMAPRRPANLQKEKHRGSSSVLIIFHRWGVFTYRFY